MSQPVCIIIAGPNGAGKTTYARKTLSKLDCHRFINADLIATELSPRNPESEAVRAGRKFLGELQTARLNRTNFAFETTLSGKSYLGFIRDLLSEGWIVELHYLWLKSVEQSLQRVTERVAKGGHSIPPADIQRRYQRSIENLLDHYSALCSFTICIDNSSDFPVVVFEQDADGRIVENETRYQLLLRKIGR